MSVLCQIDAKEIATNSVNCQYISDTHALAWFVSTTVFVDHLIRVKNQKGRLPIWCVSV